MAQGDPAVPGTQEVNRSLQPTASLRAGVGPQELLGIQCLQEEVPQGGPVSFSFSLVSKSSPKDMFIDFRERERERNINV